MKLTVSRIARNVAASVRHPGRLMVIGRRLVPLRAMLRDPEAYHMVSSWSSGQRERHFLHELFPGIQSVSVALEHVYDRVIGASVDTQELVALMAITRHIGARRVLEIGTYDGLTARNLAANLSPEGSVVTMDLPPDGERDGISNASDPALVGKHFRGEHASRIRQVLGDSTRVDWTELGGPFDLVFIDGCHDYDFVRSDSLNALKVLAPHGVCVWHDYGIIEGVSRAVDEMQGQLEVFPLRGGRLAVGLTTGARKRFGAPAPAQEAGTAG